MSYWETASPEQKLAQIDGAIECLMTAKQCAMNVKTEPHRVVYFAKIHGRHFTRDTEALRRRFLDRMETGTIRSLINRAERYHSSPVNSALAKIFPDEDRRGMLFDSHPHDEELV